MADESSPPSSPPVIPSGLGDRRTLRDDGRAETPLRRRRTADREIAAQSASEPTDPVSLVQGIVERLNTREADIESRLLRSDTALASLTSLVSGLQDTIQSLMSQLVSTSHGPAVGQVAQGTTAATAAAAVNPSPALPQSAGIPTSGEPAAAAIPSVLFNQHEGGDAAGVSSSTEPGVPGSAMGMGAAPSLHVSASSGGIPGLVSGFSVKDLKIPDLPLLGKPPDALPYTKWCKSVKIKLGALGVGAVLSDSWTPSTPQEVQWWNCVNPLVHAALYDSVQSHNTLSDNVARFFASEGAGRLAWNAIKAFHVRLAEGNRETLLLKLNALVPGERETMESFLCRCNNLREEFQQYNLTLDDSLLISHVFGQLDHTWRWMSDMANVPADTLSWHDVCDALQRQDNQRRQGQKQNPLILPLGWVPRDLNQKSKVGAAHAVQRGSPRQSSSYPLGSKGRGGGAGHKTIPGGVTIGTPDVREHAPGVPGQRRGSAVIVCFCCLEFGHGCLECPKRTAGWKVTPEMRAKALSLRDAHLRKGDRPPRGDGGEPRGAFASKKAQSPHVL